MDYTGYLLSACLLFTIASVSGRSLPPINCSDISKRPVIKHADIGTEAFFKMEYGDNSPAVEEKNRHNTTNVVKPILYSTENGSLEYKLEKGQQGNETIVGKDASDIHTRCYLQISKISADEFDRLVLYEKANLVTLSLRFPELLNVSWRDGVILPLEWRWVHRVTNSYLQMPYASYVWSLGLLYLHAKGPISIQFNITEYGKGCQNLTIGTEQSDQIIGSALGAMTQHIASKEMQYNTSKWCYQRKIPSLGKPMLIGWNLFREIPSLEYVCCSYRLDQPSMEVQCSQRQGYGFVWFTISQVLGRLMLLYFPLLFLKLNGKVHNCIKNSCKPIDDNLDVKNYEQILDGNEKFIFVENTSPVTLCSMFANSLSRLIPVKQSIKSRIAICIWSLSTLIFPGIELLMWYFWLHDYAVHLARNQISFGYSAMLAGWEASKCKLRILGGPYIAVALYLLIGWILMLIPKNMSDLIYLGVKENEKHGNTCSILRLNQAEKEELGSVKIRKYSNGYTTMYKLLLCHLHMILNPDFWNLAAKILKSRWISLFSFMTVHLPSLVICIIILPCFVVYILYSFVEISIATIYFSIPMFGFFVCITKAFNRGIQKYISENFTRIGCVLRVLLGLLVFLLQMYYLFMFIKLFLQSFNFISRVLIFTYTAIVAYPRETYGYILLFLTSVSCGIQMINSFGHIYRHILKIAVKLCEKHDTLRKHHVCRKDEVGNDIYGISRDLYEHIIEDIRPRRVQILHVVMQFVTMVFVLTVSMYIIVKFDKFEDLSLLVQVFITMFICSLPSIYNSISSTKQKKQKLSRKILKIISSWKLNERLVD